MKKQSLINFGKQVRKTVSKKTPGLLTGLGITGGIVTVVFAVRATPKALILIEEAKCEKVNPHIDFGEMTRAERLDVIEGAGDKANLTVSETIKAAWKPYIPAAVMGAVSIACLIGATSVNARRNAALTTAYKLSEAALAEFKDKATEVVGEEKINEVKDKIAKDKIDKTPVTKNEVIITDKGGQTLCFESVSGRYFTSDVQSIEKAVNELNRRMLMDMYISLSEFYDALGLDHTKISDELGWNIDEGLIEITFSSQISDDGRPCLVVDYETAPRYDFYKFV